MFACRAQQDFSTLSDQSHVCTRKIEACSASKARWRASGGSSAFRAAYGPVLGPLMLGHFLENMIGRGFALGHGLGLGLGLLFLHGGSLRTGGGFALGLGLRLRRAFFMAAAGFFGASFSVSFLSCCLRLFHASNIASACSAAVMGDFVSDWSGAHGDHLVAE